MLLLYNLLLVLEKRALLNVVKDSQVALHKSKDIWAYTGQFGAYYCLHCTTSCHFVSLFLFHPEKKNFTVYVNCINAATVNMSGLSPQVAMLLINISLLNFQWIWAYFH